MVKFRERGTASTSGGVVLFSFGACLGPELKNPEGIYRAGAGNIMKVHLP